MIVLGAYPDAVPATSGSKPLTALERFLARLDGRLALHLLPFYPSDGDGGFAPSSLAEVQPQLGDWHDIRRLAQQRRLIVDGIYNHVGFSHPLARAFFADPLGDHVLFAFRPGEVADAPNSPRGGAPLRLHTVLGQRWLLWQTFSAVAADIQIEHPQVLAMIDEHLNLIADCGCWGVRLDAPAYFAKVPGEQHRHHPQAYRLTRRLADLALAKGLMVTAQLDCDEHGLGYLPREDGYEAPIVDYAFSAQLALALLTEDVTHLAAHLRATWNLSSPLLRAPRTHDGILLRSKLLSETARARLVTAARDVGLAPRMIDGRDYEFNCSLPELYAKAVGPQQMYARLELAVLISVLAPGWAYLYLPMLLGELPSPLHADDPRALNRQPVGADSLANFAVGRSGASMRQLLTVLVEIDERLEEPEPGSAEAVQILAPSVLAVERAGPVRAVLNLSASAGFDLRYQPSGAVLVARRLRGAGLGPLGFVVWNG